ncbi:hypothetical protein JG687_00006699 [Phytophthora cactorum]|uniref:Uncharacterized protein n=1 Tax=Phytophthora cactorum TaxID=29920 RepID=A0A8T1UIW1_9STRA|nr:hypothetical protein JG687_00006699 [Phytophthora cactorum]
MQASCVDDTFAKFTGFGAAYLRAIESMRSDRIVNDPFPMRLTHQNRAELEKLLLTTSKPSSLWLPFARDIWMKLWSTVMQQTHRCDSWRRSGYTSISLGFPAWMPCAGNRSKRSSFRAH